MARYIKRRRYIRRRPRRFTRRLKRRSYRKARKLRRLPLDDRKTSRIVKLRYSVSGVQAAGTAGLMSVMTAFRANSIYDPNSAVGGTTVLDYTKWAGQYNHYHVLGSKITYTIVQAAGDMTSLVFLTKVDDNGTSFSGANPYYEWESDPTVKMKAFNLSSDTKPFKFSRKFSTKRFLGKRPTDTSALFGANPAEQAYFCSALQCANLTDQVPTFTYIVRIDYIVKLSEPKDLVGVY